MNTALALAFPRDVRPEAMEALLLRLHGLLRTGGPFHGTERLSFELLAGREGTRVEVRLPDDRVLRAAQDAYAAAFPGGTCHVVNGDQTGEDGFVAFRRISLGRAAAMLRTDLPLPGFQGLLAPLGRLGTGQRVILQFVLLPTASSEQRRLATRAGRPPARRRSEVGVLASVQLSAGQRKALRDKAVAPLFRVGVLVAASSPSLVRTALAGFAQFAAPYASARQHSVLWTARARRQLAHRTLPLWPVPTLLNAQELAAVLGPSPEALRLARGPIVRSRRLPAPQSAPRRGRPLCVSSGAREHPVALSREDSLLHTWLIGPTGTGKSTLMAAHAVAAAEQGDGVVLLDPKGDLLEAVLLRVPERRAGDVIVVDPVSEAAHPVGLNLLERASGQDAAAVAESVLAVMRDLFSRNWGARTDDTLFNGLFTAAQLPGTTFAELPRLFGSAPFRAPYLAALSDPFVRDFWSGWERLAAPEQAAILAPVLNKLRPLLRPDLAPIIGQRKSTLDLGEVLSKRKLLLIRLPRDGALFGSLIVARLWQAAQRRLALPENRRPHTLLAIDEVHAFLRTGGDLGEMLAMARGLKLSLCVACQHLEQCPPALRAALLANARTRVVFQTDEADAAQLARGFAPELECADLTGLGRFEVAIRMALDGAVTPAFTGRTEALGDAVRASSEPLRALSRSRYARPRAEVAAELRDRLGEHAASAGLSGVPIGGRG